MVSTAWEGGVGGAWKAAWDGVQKGDCHAGWAGLSHGAGHSCPKAEGGQPEPSHSEWPSNHRSLRAVNQ